MKNQFINSIHHGNCLELMARMPDDFVDLTVTSPPYDNMRDNTWNGKVRPGGFKGMNLVEFRQIAKELLRITKPGGVVVWNVNDATENGCETGTSFRQALFFRSIGFRLHDTMIYYKTNALNFSYSLSSGRRRYHQAFEYMFVLSKGQPATFRPYSERCKTAGQKYYSVKIPSTADAVQPRQILEEPRIKKEYKLAANVWFMSAATINYGHPAPFPIELPKRHIETWSKPGDLVFDPFAGSGNTLMAADQLRRKFLGAEISKDYYEIIKKRLYCNPENFFVEPLDEHDAEHNQAQEMVEKKHYLKSMPCNAQIWFGVFKKPRQLVGVILYGRPERRELAESISDLIKPDEIKSLLRLWIEDGPGLKNIESWAIARTFEWLRIIAPEVKMLVSYADACIHAGTIYQAGGWLFQDLYGETNSTSFVFTTSFCPTATDFVHGRTAFRRYKTNSPQRLAKIFGRPILVKPDICKYRYLNFLCGRIERKRLRKSFKHPISPYPKVLRPSGKIEVYRP